MERREFESRVATATAHILQQTREWVLEEIPDAVCFSLAIEAWKYVVPLEPCERVFPDDPQRFPEEPRRRVTSAELVELLWRDGRVPRWIDLVLVAVEDGRAVIRTDASPRFTDNPAILDNPHNQDSPFLVKLVGPPPWVARTPWRVPLERYSLTWRADPEAARRTYTAGVGRDSSRSASSITSNTSIAAHHGRSIAGGSRSSPRPNPTAHGPALVWNGSGYGVLWIESTPGRPSDDALYFVRLSAAGAREGAAMRLPTDGREMLAAGLAWSGRGYVAVWSTRHGPERDTRHEIHLVGLTADGATTGAPQRLSAANEMAVEPVVAWSGEVYGVAWRSVNGSAAAMFAGAMRFVRVSAAGTRIGAPAVVHDPVQHGEPSLLAHAGRFVLGWNGRDVHRDRSELVVQSIGPDGAVAPAIRVDLEPTHNPVRLAGDGDVMAAIWTGEARDGSWSPWLCSVVRGQLTAPRRIACPEGHVGNPCIAGGGPQLGVAWSLSSGPSTGVFFGRVDRDGTLVGAPVRVDTGPQFAVRPQIVWTGHEYGLVWIDGRDGTSIYFGRVDATGVKQGADLPVRGRA